MAFPPFRTLALQVFERIEPALTAVRAEMKRISSKYWDDFVRYRMESAAHGEARKRRLNDLGAEVQARLERAALAKGHEVPEPRYDDVFAAGVQWLDALAGEPVREGEGKLTFGQDV